MRNISIAFDQCQLDKPYGADFDGWKRYLHGQQPFRQLTAQERFEEVHERRLDAVMEAVEGGSFVYGAFSKQAWILAA